jgi:hypothetical protein
VIYGGLIKFIHLKGVLQNLFKSVLDFHSSLNALIFAIPSLMIIITFHSTFRIFLCVSNTKKIMEASMEASLVNAHIEAFMEASLN